MKILEALVNYYYCQLVSIIPYQWWLNLKVWIKELLSWFKECGISIDLFCRLTFKGSSWGSYSITKRKGGYEWLGHMPLKETMFGEYTNQTNHPIKVDTNVVATVSSIPCSSDHLLTNRKLKSNIKAN